MKSFYVEYNVFEIVDCLPLLRLTLSSIAYSFKLTKNSIEVFKSGVLDQLKSQGFNITNFEVQIVSIVLLEEDY